MEHSQFIFSEPLPSSGCWIAKYNMKNKNKNKKPWSLASEFTFWEVPGKAAVCISWKAFTKPYFFRELPSPGSLACDYISLHVIHLINIFCNMTVSTIIFPTLHVHSVSSQTERSSSYPLFSTLLRFLSFCSNPVISHCFELLSGTCNLATNNLALPHMVQKCDV